MRDTVNDRTRLELMLEAIENIVSFTNDVSNCEAFESNKILCHAVVYNLQCIGENVYKLSREFVQSHPQMDWDAIEGLRHILVHDYYQVNMKMVWQILQKDLPVLKAFLMDILFSTTQFR